MTTSSETSTSRDPYGAPGSGRTVGIIIVTLFVVVPLLVVGGLAINVYNSLGGHAYSINDHTVDAARKKADAKARKDLALIESRMSPAAGAPDLTALLDTCVDSNGAWSFNNDISCSRTYYLFYRVTDAAGAPERIPTSSELLCTYTTTPSCLREVGLQPDVQVSRTPSGTSWRPLPWSHDIAAKVDYEPLEYSATHRAGVLVTYTLSYFSG